MMLFRLLAVVLILVNCGCSTHPHQPAVKLLDPQSIANTVLNLSVAGMPDSEGVHIYFSNDRFATDFTDLNGLSPGGTYRYLVETQDTVRIIQNVDSSPEFPSGRLEAKLRFATATTGTYTFTAFYKGKTDFKLHGRFSIAPTEFDLTQHLSLNERFDIWVQNASSSDFSVQSNTLMGLQHDSRKSICFEMGDKKYRSTDYKVSKINATEMEVTGHLIDSNWPYIAHFSFTDLRNGAFSLDIGDGQNVITGSFHWFRITWIDTTSPMKGKLVEGTVFKSSITGIEYPYEVYLPPGYEQSSTSYPVIYASDGQWTEWLSYLLDNKNKKVVLVAINQGLGDRREIDYRPPGSQMYIKFLKSEFVPFIESKYKVTQDRTYLGQSLGGTLGAHLISEEPIGTPYFKNYILCDGAFWALTPEILRAEDARFKSSHKLPISVFFSSTRQGNSSSVAAYTKRFRHRQYEDFHIVVKEYNKLMHEEITSPSFDDFIDLVFPSEKVTPAKAGVQ